MPDETTTIPYGYCRCGCGEKTRLYPANNKNRGWVKGEPYPFKKGHNGRKVPVDDPGPNPSGLCMCGCGEKTGIAEVTQLRTGDVAGTPRCYLRGHNKKFGPLYEVKDCGFDSPCWVWRGSLVQNGYGGLRVGEKRVPAHRHFYETMVGPIPEGLHIDHLCRVPACVNPDHLEPVTSQINTQRGDKAHLTPAQVREIRKSPDSRRGLAERYGCSTSNIAAIQTGRSWANIK
jgi:hypothetical protein